MGKKDSLQRFLFDNAFVRGEIVHLEESFQMIVHQHNYPEPIKHLLGEALAVSALLSAIIKFDGRLTVQFRGKGNLKLLLAQCDNQFHLRGLVKWEGDLTYSELMDAFHDGILVIMLDSENNKTRYQGIVAWQGNSLAESIEGYFKKSEQLSTKIWLSVSKHAASGLLLQIIPDEKKETNVAENEVIQNEWKRLNNLASQLEPQILLREDNETLLRYLFPAEEIRIFPIYPISFHCTCSRQRSVDAIQILGQEEAEAELKNNQTIVVTCDFCNKEYIFDRKDIATIFEKKPPHTQLH